ncbi:MAG: T9SS type A sorting domain-containing protein [Flavobacteriales bacterium]
MRTERLPILAALCLSLGTGPALMAQSGALDPTFNSTGYVVQPVNGHDGVQKILLQDDGKILSLGMSWDDTYTARAYVFRYMPDGTLDTDFATDGMYMHELDNEALLYSAVITATGKILLVGSTTDYQTYRMMLIQLNADGTPDASFGTDGIVLQSVSAVVANAEDMLYDVKLDGDGNILACGSSYDENYVRRPVVVRFTPSGVLDTTFGVNGLATIPVNAVGSSSFQGIAVQPDGKIVATGYFGETEWWYTLLLVRFNAGGTLDDSFSVDGIVKYNYGNVDDQGQDLELTDDGSILVAGRTVTVTYNYSTLLMKFTPDGEVDASFGTAGAVEEDLDDFDYGWEMALQADGKIIMAGTSGDGPPNGFDLAVWKYQADGTPDMTFGDNGLAMHVIPDYYTMIYGLDVQADGKILIGGQARTTNNENYFFTARLENDIASGIGASAENSDALVVWPNPFNDQVTVRIDARTGSVRVELFNAAGQRVLDETRNNMDLVTVRTTHLPAGSYMLRLTTDKTSITSTLVK